MRVTCICLLCFCCIGEDVHVHVVINLGCSDVCYLHCCHNHIGEDIHVVIYLACSRHLATVTVKLAVFGHYTAVQHSGF